MILLLPVALSLLIALLRGGSLNRLAKVPFKHGWLAFVAIGLQVAAVSRQELAAVAAWIFILSYALLVALVLINRRLAGVPILGLGLGLNALATAVNGGYMPVTIEAVERAGLTHLVYQLETGARVLGSKNMILSRADANLWFLGDVFVIRGPWPTVFSVGDVLLALGILVFFQLAMLPARAAESPRSSAPIAE